MKKDFLITGLNFFIKKVLFFIYAICFFTSFSTMALDSNLNGINVDVSKEYPDLISNRIEAFGYGKHPNLNNDSSNLTLYFYNIGNKIVYTNKDNANTYSLYSYDINTKKVENLFQNIRNIHGLPAKITMLHLKPYSSNKILARLYISDDNISNRYIVTDGTLSGTYEWDDEFGSINFGYDDINTMFTSFKWKSNSGIYYTIGNELFLKNNSSDTVIADNFTYSQIAHYELDGTLYFLPDFYPEHKEIDVNRYTPTLITTDEYFFLHNNSRIGSFSFETGYQNYFYEDDIPSCKNNNKVGLDGVVNNITRHGDELFFSDIYSSNGESCIFAYNTKTKAFRFLNINNISDVPLIGSKIIGTSETGIVFQTLKDETSVLSAAIFKIDFSFQKLTKLYNRDNVFALAIEPIFNNGEHYYYYHYNKYFNDNILVRLNIFDFTYEVINDRIGVAEENTINEFRGGGFIDNNFQPQRIVNGELYFTYSLPYPGLYKLNPTSKRTEVIDFAHGFNTNNVANIISVDETDKGWLVIQQKSDYHKTDDNRTFYEYELTFVGFDGLIEHISYLDSASTLEIPVIYRSNGESYITAGRDLYLIDIANFDIQKVASETYNQKTYKFKAIHDNYAFAESDSYPQEFIKVSLINDQVLNSYTGSDGEFKSCGNTFIIYEPYEQYEVKIIKGNTFETILKNIYPTDISFDATPSGFLYFISDNAVYRYNCNSNTEPEIIHNTVSGRNFRFFNNSFDQTKKEFHYSLDAPNGDWYQEVYTVSLPGNVSLNPAENISTPMLNFNKSYGINSLYIIDHREVGVLENGYYNKIDTSEIDIISKYSGDKSFDFQGSSDDNRYLFGRVTYTYSEEYRGSIHYHFIIDSLEQKIYFFYEKIYTKIDSIIGSKLFLSISNSDTKSSNEIKILDIACITNGQCDQTTINRKPILSNGDELFFNTGDKINFPFRAYDEDKDSLSFQLLNAPSWLTIDNNGIISGSIPDESVGVLDSISVEVSDGIETVTSTPFTFHILQKNRAPIWLATPEYRADFGNRTFRFGVNTNFEFNLANLIYDIERDKIAYSINAPISGVSVSTEGLFKANITQAGKYYLTLTLKDAKGASSDIEVTLDVFNNSTTTTPETPNPEPESSSGSGGAINLVYLLLLLIVILIRRNAHCIKLKR